MGSRVIHGQARTNQLSDRDDPLHRTHVLLESDLSRGDYPGVIHFSFLSFGAVDFHRGPKILHKHDTRSAACKQSEKTKPPVPMAEIRVTRTSGFLCLK